MDRSDSNVPARMSSDSFRAPVPVYAPPQELANVSAPQINPLILLRGLGRHWWRILLLWIVVSTPLAFLIYSFVPKTYEAFTIIQIEPTKESLFVQGGQANGLSASAAQPYLETQVVLMTSDKVLDHAISLPATQTTRAINKFPMIANSKDPKTDLRKELTVEILRNTFVIRVALASRDPEEAAAIVNAVVDSFMSEHTDYHRNANKTLTTSLNKELGQLNDQISEKKKELKALFGTGNVDPILAGNRLKSVAGKADEPEGQPTRNSVTEDQYNQATMTLLQTGMQILEAEADLEAAKEQLERNNVAMQDRETRGTNEQIEARIEKEFLNEPEAAALVSQMTEAEDELENIKSKARRDNDPAKQAVEKRIRTLKQKWEKLWKDRHDMIEQTLLTSNENAQPETWQAKIVELQVHLEKLKKKKDGLEKHIGTLEVQRKVQGSDTFSASMASQELGSLVRMQGIIQQRLEELRFESSQDVYRITPPNRAQKPIVPANNKQIRFIMAAPAIIMFGVLGLFLLIELKAQRIADPDALSTRVQSEVFALPPLPTARSIRRRSATEADDQIEQFIQRLDHVRFAVCGSQSDLSKGRCILITSAIGREGKTTLAAQLAARCGNAGMSTLLIDADLRRTGLCALLDVPEGPGLSDLLGSDDLNPTDLVIPVQGGTFHLLTAGTPIPDPSRGLQNRKLGLLITQFRQIYDLVIIDSPPVLPVPDALIMGQWADGAVLAVRYDSSRFPQVERARRQLDGAGICVLGTVINGMRNSDSYYGSYSYRRPSSPQPDPSTAV